MDGEPKGNEGKRPTADTIFFLANCSAKQTEKNQMPFPE
jgi:hypothetical protein